MDLAQWNLCDGIYVMELPLSCLGGGNRVGWPRVGPTNLPLESACKDCGYYLIKTYRNQITSTSTVLLIRLTS